MAIKYRVNQEIKFLYKKKQQLNTSLYKTHLECAEFWKNLWPTIQEKIEHKFSSITENIYNGLHKKLEKLKQNELITKPWETEQQPHFHPRVLNLSNTSITEQEREVLEKSLCYAITSNVNRTIIDIENILNNLDEQSKKGYRIIAFNKPKRMIVSNTGNTLHKRILHTTRKLKKNYVAMGSPISGTMAEVFLQHYEKLYVKHLLEEQAIAYYARYEDDILIVFDSSKITTSEIQKQTENIHKNIGLKMNMENNNRIEYLDLLIIRLTDRMEIDIYRKPTTTDLTIHATSNHPMEHKLAAYRYYLHRLNTLPLTTDKKNRELNTIKHIAVRNGYSINIVENLNRKIKQSIQKRSTNKEDTTQRKKRIVVTYTGPHIRTLMNIFRSTNIQITYKSDIKISKILTSNKELPNKMLNSGIYELMCQTCNYAYVGQTSRDLHTRYKEHIRYIRNNDPKSAYAQHILDNQHEFGPAHKTIELIQACNKRNEILHWENLYIQKYSTEGKLISEQTPHEYTKWFKYDRDKL